MKTPARPTDVRSVRSGDADLFVRAVGGGPRCDTLIVLGGGPGLSHDYLIGIARLASPNLRVVLYDQRGTGRSTGGFDRDVLDRQVGDLLAVMDAVGARRPHLLGHSAGGLLLALAARMVPASIGSAVFVDSAPLTRSELDAAMHALENRVTELTAAGVLAPPEEPADPTSVVRGMFPGYFHDPHHPRAGEHGAVTHTPSTYDAILEALGDYDITQGLSALNTPSLVIACGSPFGVEMGSSVIPALPVERVVSETWEDCGHFPWLEHRNRFEATVRGFIT